MKKITFFLVFIILVQLLTNCKKNDAINPAPVDTATITQTWTITETHTVSPTVSPTATNTPTNTPLPTIDSSILISVPGGTFTQSDTSGNGFSHTISAFMIGKYEVTYNLWYTVYQWAVANGYTFANAGGGSGDTPVTNVSWRNVIVWCNAYSQEAGLTPCYTYSSAVIKDSTNATACDNAVCAWANNGYRLPSEGEWQYAASYIDGTNWTPYNYASGATADYNNATATGLVAWYFANCSSTQTVGGKTANALGIYDMSGNVWEWCWDWYDVYPGTARTDYRGSGSGSYRVLRGGSFGDFAHFLRVSYRYYYGSYYAYSFSGFRFARTN